MTSYDFIFISCVTLIVQHCTYHVCYTSLRALCDVFNMFYHVLYFILYYLSCRVMLCYNCMQSYHNMLI